MDNGAQESCQYDSLMLVVALEEEQDFKDRELQNNEIVPRNQVYTHDEGVVDLNKTLFGVDDEAEDCKWA